MSDYYLWITLAISEQAKNERIKEWINEWINKWKNKRMNEWTDEKMNEGKKEQEIEYKIKTTAILARANFWICSAFKLLIYSGPAYIQPLVLD